jgi:hypothetical protein
VALRRNPGRSRGVEYIVRRHAPLVLAILAASGCGTSSAGTETDSLAPVVSVADPTIASTSVVPTDQPTTGVPNFAASTALVPEADVVVDDPLVPGAWNGARTSRDGLRLSLSFVGAPDYEPGQPCTMRYVPVVNETDAKVDVAIRGEHPPATADDAMMCAAMGYERSLTVDLTQPFGNRTLFALGQARGVFDGSTLAEPQWMPDGWQADGDSPGLFQDGISWTRSWRPAGDGSCPLGTSGLALLEGVPDVVSRSIPLAEQTVTGSHDINGTIATETVQANRNITRLAWTVGDRSYVLSSAPACDGDEPPSLDTVLRFARSLETPTDSVVATDPTDVAPSVDALEPGEPRLVEFATHCGVGFLSRSINDHWWRTLEAGDESGWLPAEWSSPEAVSGLLLELLLSKDGKTLTVTYNGRSVEYEPTDLRTSDPCA